MNIERILHSQGFGSRKECRALILGGQVSVAGVVHDDPTTEFNEFGDGKTGIEFSVGGEHWRFRAQVYLMLHKPAGYECSNKPTFHPSIFRLLPHCFQIRGVQCLGRLDQDTTGLLLLSDDGQFIHQWSSGKKNIPKAYEVRLKHAFDAAMIDALLAGVRLHDEATPVAAADCVAIDDRHLLLTLREGKYHQVKRMIAAAGNRVEALHRSRIGGLALDPELQSGQWRWLEAEDFACLAKFIQ
ncbi:MAG: pseudouridine synthase [Azoarcus sp.]|jgi:16S rRNA pseudouridine516 synthase|nr:pseudouridine synthase [Azoarcus sp.]